MNFKLPSFKMNNSYREFVLAPSFNDAIKSNVKKEKSVVYGARSIQAQIGLFSRNTMDWDIFSAKPKKSAKMAEKSLDKVWEGDHFYTKPAMHPGTFKVMSKGNDGKKGTGDDWGLIDFTIMPKPRPKTVRIGGINYRKITQEKKAKYKALKDRTQKFRWDKDNEDLNRIKVATGTTR